MERRKELSSTLSSFPPSLQPHCQLTLGEMKIFCLSSLVYRSSLSLMSRRNDRPSRHSYGICGRFLRPPPLRSIFPPPFDAAEDLPFRLSFPSNTYSCRLSYLNPTPLHLDTTVSPLLLQGRTTQTLLTFLQPSSPTLPFFSLLLVPSPSLQSLSSTTPSTKIKSGNPRIRRGFRDCTSGSTGGDGGSFQSFCSSSLAV